MSEFLYPHAQVSPRTLRLRLAGVGLVGGLMLGLLGGFLALQAVGVLSSDVRVRVLLPTVGDTLGINSDVKYNGLRVGRVVSVDPAGPEAQVLVAPQHAQLIPAAVTARVLPGTLFGNEYVDLVAASGTDPAPTAAAATHLSDGDVVRADESTTTVRLMDTFSATQRLLASVDPAQWDLALTQLADALDGRGTELATMIRDSDAFLGRWEELQPQVQRDLDLLTDDSDLMADIEPQLISALRDTRPLAKTLVEEQQGTTTLLRGLSTLLAGDEGVTSFLRAHGADTARLLNATAANLEVFAQRYPAFAQLLQKVPALLRNGAKAVQGGRIQMEGALTIEMLNPYDATDPADCPTYRGLRGNCGGAR
ncbi:MCE family protein [Nocardioides sp. CPCC 206347]|uniref:MCE family protein n=1 Tax=Nocardioides sp. CPCC 206347 TaxID=3406463 RepID=UPI003B428DC8